jgi:hypothetical protein
MQSKNVMDYKLGKRIYNPITPSPARTMENRLFRSALFATYQLTLLLGITLLPVALVARQFGVTLPINRIVTRLADAYEDTAPNSD